MKTNTTKILKCLYEQKIATMLFPRLNSANINILRTFQVSTIICNREQQEKNRK